MTGNEKIDNDGRLSVPENDGPRAHVYISHCVWFASYVRSRAELGGITEEQIIAQFEMNVRKVMNPRWQAH